MKIVIVGSCSIHLVNFYNLVKDIADDILILTDKDCNKTFGDVKVIQLDFTLKNFFTIYKIKKIIKDFKPTHIHIHQANSYAFFSFLAIKNMGIKKILNVWGSDILVNPKKNFFLKQIVKFCLKKADVIVGDSYYLLEEVKKIYPLSKVEFFNFGIEYNELNNKKQNIIYSNRLHKKNYNIDKIIISFAKFVKNNPQWELIIAGDGEEKLNLINLAKKLNIINKVKFVGFVDKKTNDYYYSISKIYVSIPDSDSISLSLVEAILHKCIPFVSNIPANKEIVKDYGFIENDLENIDFSKYDKKIIDYNFIEQIKKIFSKSENKKKLINIYLGK